MFILGYFVEAVLYVGFALLMTLKARLVWSRRGEYKHLPFDFYGAILAGLLSAMAFGIHLAKAINHLA